MDNSFSQQRTWLLYSVLAAVSCGVLALFLLPETVKGVFSSNFLPHSYCYLFDRNLIALHVGSDLAIWLSYLSISATLTYLVYRTRREIPFSWMFLAFGLFIVACGFTHLLEVIVLWHPLYWLAGDLKLLTAIASVITAMSLPPLIPKIHEMVQAASLSEARRTQLERANQELAGLNTRLQEVDGLRSRFIANVSHELRTPLTLVLAETGALLKSPAGWRSDQGRLLTIERNAQVLLKQVNDLLEAARLDAKKVVLQYRREDVARLTRLAASHFEVLAREKAMSFTVETPDSLISAVDPEKFRQIVFNLLSNAFKFTPAGGSIQISLSSIDEILRLEVRDSGIGIPSELRSQVFERFHQAELGTRRKFAGTGLGLSIVRDIVQLHGGEVSADEAPEGGARFVIEMPLRKPASTMPASDYEIRNEDIAGLIEELRAPALSDPLRFEHPAAQEAENLLARAGTVLVAEDNPEMNRYIAEMLALNYRVLTAANGKEAYDLALKTSPDLILSDIMMPEMSGEELLEALQAHPDLSHIPVILLSARADEELRLKLLRSGAQDYIVKPFSREELLARIANHVSTKLAREVLQKQLSSTEMSIAELAEDAAKKNQELVATMKDLRASEHHFKVLADAVPHMVWAGAPDGSCEYFNMRWHHYTGMTLEESQGYGWINALHPDHHPSVGEPWRTAAAAGSRPDQVHRFRRSDGEYRWHLVKSHPVHDDSGQLKRWFGTCTDIEEQKQTEEKLREVQQELESRVQERTLKLSRSNEILQVEVKKRIQAEGTLRQLSSRLLRFQDEERRRLGRELHDSIGQLLAALRINLSVIEQWQVDPDPKISSTLHDTAGLADQAIKEIRTLSYLLHPPMLDEAGLFSALRWYVEGFAARNNIKVTLNIDPEIGRLSRDLETPIFRIIQECLVNIDRHAESTTAIIDILLQGAEMFVRIADTGKGMGTVDDDAAIFGVGLRGMQERVRELSGEMEITAADPGTVIEVRLPVTRGPSNLLIPAFGVSSEPAAGD